ncbi:OsmC family protein [Flavitalea sp. BT771]|uniref:OsmC family protein n=1 Tax=Flavitalea sp. BT771 TaxID=3063329 RepID=UPI0026E1F558|nr:OsmC family protein [Flavitalea sp. BT771]MDO6435356.1 OsmC family protein [Flavitalea sp. BT771]MDV6224284.1 OsmC family protein [Flavitalea sp. BT771]
MKRTAKAHWKGNLKEGKGEISTPSSILNQTNYSFKTRFDPGVVGTNPEELIAAAHAGCFTMAISAALTQAGITANDIETEAILDLDLVGLKIDGIHLDVKAAVIDGVSEEKFKEVAEGAKSGCIVSKALNVPITLSVTYK